MIDLTEFDLVYDYGDDASGENYPADHQSCIRRYGLLVVYEPYDVGFVMIVVQGMDPGYADVDSIVDSQSHLCFILIWIILCEYLRLFADIVDFQCPEPQRVSIPC